MFSDDHNFLNHNSAPYSLSDVKVIEITPFLGLSGTNPLPKIIFPEILDDLLGRLKKIRKSALGK